jgi:hypothetical protein
MLSQINLEASWRLIFKSPWRGWGITTNFLPEAEDILWSQAAGLGWNYR